MIKEQEPIKNDQADLIKNIRHIRMKSITNKIRTLVGGLNNKFDTCEELGARSEEVRHKEKKKLKY